MKRLRHRLGRWLLRDAPGRWVEDNGSTFTITVASDANRPFLREYRYVPTWHEEQP